MPSARNPLEMRLARELGRCIEDFNLIERGDRVMVCLSGGKDSYTLLHLLERAQRRSPVPFELLAVHLDQGQPGYDGTALERWLETRQSPYRILREDTYSVVTERIAENRTYCSLCSRLRRGILYTTAAELGCTKIALGHHREDAIETLLLNLMFAGSLSAMPPRLRSEHGHTVIRPLLYCSESDIAQFAREQAFPILPCNLCGAQDNLRRQQVKQWLTSLETTIPKLRESMLAALTHVHPSHLADRGLWERLDGSAEAHRDELPLKSLRLPVVA